MCIIAICRTRKLTADELKNCWNSNKDGAGFAYALSDTEVHMEKGFMRRKQFLAAYKKVDTLPHIVHFRISSSGGVIPPLTHPFVCAPGSPQLLSYTGRDMLLFHNGICIGWQAAADKLLGDKWSRRDWSDTRVAAAVIGGGVQTASELLPTAGGKFVTIQGKSIWRYGDFVEEDGVLFSNSGFKYSATIYRWSGDYYDDWNLGGCTTQNAPCPTCGNIPSWSGWCNTCQKSLGRPRRVDYRQNWHYRCTVCQDSKYTQNGWCNKCQKMTDGTPKPATRTESRQTAKWKCSECDTDKQFERNWCHVCRAWTDGEKADGNGTAKHDKVETDAEGRKLLAAPASADTRDDGHATGNRLPCCSCEFKELSRAAAVCRNCTELADYQKRVRGN